jgi:hypothetical protein
VGESGAFQASPHHMSITKGKEATLYVSFVPRAVGVYGGALTVKSNRKTYVILLRGECKAKAQKTTAKTATAKAATATTATSMSTSPAGTPARAAKASAREPESPGIGDLLGDLRAPSARTTVHEKSTPKQDKKQEHKHRKEPKQDAPLVADSASELKLQQQLRQEEQAVGSSVKLKKLWLQQWLTQNQGSSDAQSQYECTASSSESLEQGQDSSCSGGSREALEQSSVSALSDPAPAPSSISIIPQTVLLFSYDQEVTKYIHRSASSSSSSALFAQRTYKSKFVIRNFGHAGAAVTLSPSTPMIKIVNASIKINAHCDAW